MESRKEITKKLNDRLLSNVKPMEEFMCSEVTIGIGGKQRVDFMSIDTKHVVKCYEVKSCKEDFYSKAKHTFVGHYNYYVMDKDTYEVVKNDIPKNIGVTDGYVSLKRATKVNTKVSMKVIYISMIRSLYRDASKVTDVGVDRLKKHISNLKSEVNTLKKNRKSEFEYYSDITKENTAMRRMLLDKGIGINEIEKRLEKYK